MCIYYAYILYYCMIVYLITMRCVKVLLDFGLRDLVRCARDPSVPFNWTMNKKVIFTKLDLICVKESPYVFFPKGLHLDRYPNFWFQKTSCTIWYYMYLFLMALPIWHTYKRRFTTRPLSSVPHNLPSRVFTDKLMSWFALPGAAFHCRCRLRRGNAGWPGKTFQVTDHAHSRIVLVLLRQPKKV